MQRERCYYGNRFDNPNHLEHWRYIKKKRVNGKWRYYYDRDQMRKDLGYDAKKDMQRAETQEAVAAIKLDAAKERKKEAGEKYLNASNNYASYKYSGHKVKENYGKEDVSGILFEGVKTYYNKAEKDLSNAERNYRNAQQKTRDLVAKYEKTPLGRLETMSDAIGKGIKSVKKFLSKPFKKKKKKVT